MSKITHTLTLAGTVDRLEAARGALVSAREALLEAELSALAARFNVESIEAETAAESLRAQATAPPDCANETQRKAYALSRTAAHRETANELRIRLLSAEVELARAKSALRLVEDERRTTEALLALFHAGLLPLAPRAGIGGEEEIPF